MLKLTPKVAMLLEAAVWSLFRFYVLCVRSVPTVPFYNFCFAKERMLIAIFVRILYEGSLIHFMEISPHIRMESLSYAAWRSLPTLDVIVWR